MTPILSLLALSIISSLVSLSCNLISKACICLFLLFPHPEIIVEAASPKPIKAIEQKNIIKNILLKGKRLVLFPEGTSSDGNRVLKFKSSLFSVAENNTNKEDSYAIQAVTICYKGINGLPMLRSERPYISWWGDMGLLNHIWNILSFSSVEIIVIAHEPIQNSFDRKVLSTIAWKQVSHGLGLAMSGRAKSLKYNERIFEIV